MSKRLSPQRKKRGDHRSTDAARKRAERNKASAVKIRWKSINWQRREAALKSSLAFAETYLKQKFYLPFSDLHRTVFSEFDALISEGGRQALAAPRGFGKTSLCVAAILRAALGAFKKYIPYLCDNANLSEDRLSLIKAILTKNDLLFQDFPEVCACVRALDGRPQRALSQHVGGLLTNLEWRSDEILLPRVKYPKLIAARLGREYTVQARVIAKGMSAAVRGALSDEGRPDLVVIDDPQGDESAASLNLINKRRKLIRRGLAQLSSMGSSISMILLCTIIEADDVADEFTNRDKEPAWNGLRYRFIEKMPEPNTEAARLWDEYVRLRREKDPADKHARAAHNFYLANHAAMDAGAVCNLPFAYAGRHVIEPPDTETKNVLPDGSEKESSALEHAYNVIADDGLEAFLSEYQNAPPDELADEGILTSTEICTRLNGLDRGRVPLDAQTVTGFIDVQDRVLYWLVCAWGHDFTGAVLDYGTWPKQPGGDLVNVRRSLKAATGATDKEGAWFAGLTALTNELADREWIGESGSALRLARLMVDANYGDSTPTVYQFCRTSPHASILLPSHGRGITHNQKPISMFLRKPGELKGLEWRVTHSKNHASRHVLYDTNFWKSFVHARLAAVVGSRGGITLFGSKPEAHVGLAQQLTAETRVKKSGDGRECWEWHERPDRRANHLLDCLTGAAVAASVMGCAPAGDKNPKRKKRTGSLAELQRRKRLERERGMM